MNLDLTTPAAFVFVLGIIIFCHEFGHFITAKLFGMRVFIFSFGFGKRLVGFKWGDTDCRISLVPLGGYVKLEGEPDDHLSEDLSSEVKVLTDGTIVRVASPDYFTNRPRWQRFIVYLAGPFMNAVLTISVLSVLFMIGSQVDATLHDRPLVGAVEPGSPAEAAGIRPGDEIAAIDDKPQETWEDAQYAILIRPDATLHMKLRRGGEERETTVHSESTATDRVGKIGVAPMVRVGGLLPGEPAEAAGLKKDDAILRIGDKPVTSFEDIPQVLGGAKDATLTFQVYRDGQTLELPVTPRGGRIGIERKTVVKKFGLGGALAESLRFSWSMTRQTFEVVGRLLTAKISPRTMMGPLGIAQASGNAARGGLGPLFWLVAIISLQVGILNLFPLAPLDGGHLAILLSEGALRRDFSIRVKAWIMNAGAMVLFLLIGLVLYSDLAKTALLGKYLR
jgi:regulator of sigma E protease